jgi:hypothetical protein
MFEQTVSQDVDVLALIQRELENARPKVRRLMFRVATGPAVLKTLRGLMVEPGKPTYPIRWQSEKQRRYVMAKLTREKNLPYMRTHRLAQGWTAVVGEGMTIQFVNRDKSALFVQGKYQQIMHKGRWPYAPSAIEAATPAITAETRDRWFRSFGKAE